MGCLLPLLHAYASLFMCAIYEFVHREFIQKTKAIYFHDFIIQN